MEATRAGAQAQQTTGFFFTGTDWCA